MNFLLTVLLQLALQDHLRDWLGYILF
ncbi:uncharacterized protein METZ01_LOCUS126196 [marine metagenome]|uniref:Uncharacterized protein n=1 Tax=marine metagenome TaxID=408172 RepID=A0A381Y9R1_9ZZZZ